MRGALLPVCRIIDTAGIRCMRIRRQGHAGWFAKEPPSRRSQATDDVVAALSDRGGHSHLLVLAEDWCGDAVNSLPVVARPAQSVPNVDVRVQSRDAHP